MYRKAIQLAILGSAIFIATAQQPTPRSVFTQAQSDAGRIAYTNTCGQCHTPNLMGRKGDSGEFPTIASLSPAYQKFIGSRGYVRPLAGPEFLDRFGTKTASELITRFQETVDSFPPEGMNDQTTINIVAYVLQANGAKPGSAPLTKSASDVFSSLTRRP